MAKKPDATPAHIGPPPAHPFVSDPGGVFETDAHRRVLGLLPSPDEESTTRALLRQRVAEDDSAHSGRMEGNEFEGVLDSLIESGYVDTTNGLTMTSAGHDALQGGADD